MRRVGVVALRSARAARCNVLASRAFSQNAYQQFDSEPAVEKFVQDMITQKFPAQANADLNEDLAAKFEVICINCLLFFPALF